MAILPCSDSANAATIEQLLDRWVEEGDPNFEDRPLLKRDVMAFLCDADATTLKIHEKCLRTLPHIFHTHLLPERLRALTINSIRQLSWIPPAIWGLNRLTHLNLCGNPISAIPPEVGQMNALEELWLAVCRLEGLPREIGQLRSLRVLGLGINFLRSVPAEIGRLQNLAWLSLAQNSTLTGIPLEILDLPRSCRINLSQSGLSPTVRDNLRTVTEAEGYLGPRITFSTGQIYPEYHRHIPAIDLIAALYRAVNREYVPLQSIPGDVVKESVLLSWLSRLSFMCDYSSSPERKRWLITKIIEYMELADRDPNFREQFAAIIFEAGTSCGDRVALSILHLGIAHRLATIDLHDMKVLADFLLRGVWAMELLEQCAREKVPSLPFSDEIEVYLGYPIRLKERLRLPIEVEGMLYFSCSNLQQSDLDEAATFVQEKLEDAAACHHFLIDNDKWKAALAMKYPEEYAATVREREEKSDCDAITAERYEEIYNEYCGRLLVLTRRALDL